jgi:rod shape-determining protein MreC
MKSSYIKVLLLVVVAVGLIAWQNAARSRDASWGPAGVSTGILSPFQRGFRAVGDYFSDVGRVMFRRQGLTRENDELKLRLADLEGQNQRLLRYRKENDELRRMLKMPPPVGGRAVAAEIVGFDATDFSRSITLNVGSRQGVKAKDVVYCAYGLVGVVLETAPFTSTVQLVTDRAYGVGVMTSRTSAKGVVLGSGERICKFSYLDFGADVREGDVVVTSGLIQGRGAIYPKGIPVGRVIKVERDKTYTRLDAYVDPAVPFDRITAVYVRVTPG